MLLTKDCLKSGSIIQVQTVQFGRTIKLDFSLLHDPRAM